MSDPFFFKRFAELAWLAVAFFAAVEMAAAQPADSAPLYSQADGAPVVRTFSPGRWGIIGVTIVNPTNRPAELLSAHYFATDPQLQFAREIWVPRNTQRSSWYPVLPPLGQARAFMDVRALLIDRSAGNEVLLKGPQGALVSEGILPASEESGPVTAVLGEADVETAALVQATRVAGKMSPRLLRLRTDSLLPTPNSLQALDELVIGSDSHALDPGGLRAIRQWLDAGGKLWILLDRVSLATASLLVGEDLPWSVVERAELTHWQFRQERRTTDLDDDLADSRDAPGAVAGQALHALRGQISLFEPPVEMVRIAAGGVKPVYTIDGWPAAFWRRAGRGLVLFTTLGPRGWVNRQANFNPPGQAVACLGVPPPLIEPPRFSWPAPFTVAEPLRQLGGFFLRPYEKPTLPAEAFQPYLAGQVGYQVIHRWTVVAVLSGFCLLLAAAGLWLSRLGLLSHLGWIGPGTALAAALVLVTEGHRSRHVVPPTVAEVQLVEVEPGGADAHATGLLGIYSQEASPADLGSNAGGVIFPDPDDEASVSQRMVWTDLERWHWENVSWSAGLHLARFATDTRLDRPIGARATFGPGGLEGQLGLASIREAGDAVLAVPSRRNLSIRFVDAEGHFAAGPGDQLTGNRFVTGGIFSVEQSRRQALYQRLFDRHKVPRFPETPTLLAWTTPLDLGFTFAQGVHRTGSALLAIPLTLDRPAPGTAVLVPAPFLPYRSVRWSGEDKASIYDARNNEWVTSRKGAARTMLRFQVPHELLPLQVERAILTIDLNAQARPLEVIAPKGAAVEVLEARKSPVGKIRFNLDRSELLQPDAGGGLRLGISIGDAQRLPGETAPSSEWKIDDLQLELVGRTLEP